MRIEGNIVAVREYGPFFERAARGFKPNHFSIESPPRNKQLLVSRAQLKIVRVYNEAGDQFERSITDMTAVGAVGGGYYWILSWKHERRVGEAYGVKRGVGRLPPDEEDWQPETLGNGAAAETGTPYVVGNASTKRGPRASC